MSEQNTVHSLVVLHRFHHYRYKTLINNAFLMNSQTHKLLILCISNACPRLFILPSPLSSSTNPYPLTWLWPCDLL